MYRLDNPLKVICVREARALTVGKEYLVVGNDGDSIDPFDCNDYVENDEGEIKGYLPWRFKRI